jgi:TPR repeat protein
MRISAIFVILILLPVIANAEVDTLDIMNKAVDGENEAQYQLGRMYYEGKVLEKDYGRAEEWLHQAAEQGHAKAQLWLGYLYDPDGGIFRNGREYEAERLYGVKPQFPCDPEKWYREAAEQGLPQAQFELAWYYMRGFGRLGGTDEQFKWLIKAAENNNAEAQWHIGQKHWLDASLHDSDKDLVQAYMWFDLAVSSDSTDRWGAAKSRDAVGKELTADQIEEAKKLVRDWKAEKQSDKQE